MIKILFTGGGTGGHIYPIIAVARSLKVLAQKNDIAIEIMFAGPADFNLEILREEGIRTYRVPSGKLRRYFSWRLPWDLAKAFIGFCYSLLLVWFLMPDIIFAKGGYGSLAVALVGRFYAIPLMIHDSDTRPGLASRILGKIASRIAISFPPALEYFSSHKTAFVGNPIRDRILTGDANRAKARFTLKGERPLILFLEGSQGSQRLNELVGKTLKELLNKYEVIHQCGTLNIEAFSKELEEIYGIKVLKEQYYHLKGYLDEEEEADAFAVSNLIITRAGAGSIYEIAAVRKPSILVPLPESAFDHQRQNAFFYARTGAALVIEEANLTPHILLNEIKGILENEGKVSEMSKAAKEFAKPDAARKIAEGLLELALE